MPKNNKNDSFNINIPSSAIRSSEIMRHGEYSYARMSAKLSENEFVSVSYEWKNEGGYVPDSVMGMMEYIKANDESIVMNEEDVKNFIERLNK